MADPDTWHAVGADTAQDAPASATPLAIDQEKKDDPDSGSFVYEPLAAGRIRLVRIMGKLDKRIRCELVEVELSSSGEYHALSYVWGRVDAQYEILLNNRIKKVTSGVFTALTAIKNRQDLVKRELLVWIDSLSIDQDCASEKTEQIPLMGQIYSGAESVLIWFTDVPPSLEVVYETLSWLSASMELDELLNPDSEGAERSQHAQPTADAETSQEIATAICLGEIEISTLRLWSRHKVEWHNLRAFKDLVKKIAELLMEGHGRPGRAEIASILDNGNLRAKLLAQDHPFWLAFSKFMHHEWFRRVWTYQEVVLAKQAHVLLEDGRHVGWSIVNLCRRALLDEFVFYAMFDIAPSTFLENRLGHKPTIDSGILGQFSSWVSQAKELGFFLLMLSDRQATVPKDHVLGLLGLANESTRAYIAPYHSSSAAVIFVRAVKAVARIEPTFLPMIWDRYKDVQTVLADLPSWCPDFSSVPGKQLSLRWSYGQLDRKRRLEYDQISRFENGNDAATIRFLGIQLSNVVACTKKCPAFDLTQVMQLYVRPRSYHESGTVSLAQCILPEHRDWLLSLPRTFFEDADTTECFENGLGEFLFRVKHPSDAGEILFNVLALCDLLAQSEPFDEAKLQASFECSPLLNFADCRNILSKIVSLLDQISGMYILQTTSGHYGGSFRQLQPRDQLIFVPGGSFPHVLSAECDRYVGCVSVPGLLQEALPESPEDVADRFEMFCVS